MQVITAPNIPVIAGENAVAISPFPIPHSLFPVPVFPVPHSLR
ncbi:hypothetical protein [Anabaenopsis elenkinii]|nr:hypothetical protein [Anabaenopsis elenkinii]